MERKKTASCERCDERSPSPPDVMDVAAQPPPVDYVHCTLYSLVAFQLTRKGLPVTTAPFAVEIPLIAS
jgi:hypothetical protein